MKVILISGLSGSGKSVALKLMEDLGFFCVDNLPLELLPQLVTLYQAKNEVTNLAVCVDMRTRMSQQYFLPMLESIEHTVRQFDALFLEAQDSVLLNRFSETRRRHPLTNEKCTLEEALAYEREWLMPLRERSHVIDTSMLTTPKLRQYLTEWVGLPKRSLQIVFESFGFKHGMPTDADFMFDVRSLPNPHYEKHLKLLTGQDTAIKEYFAQYPEVDAMVADIGDFLQKWLPNIDKENRSYVTIAIGCTGGQHRSVYIVEALSKRFAHREVLVRHRQLPPLSVTH